MVKYDDGIERSAELLRQALPWMTRQSAGLHPVSYALWYEYVSQRNPGLRAAVDLRLQRDHQLDEKSTRELFTEFIGGEAAVDVQRLSEAMHRMLHDVSTSAADADQHTARFGDSLHRLGQALAGGPEAHADAVAQALAETQAMQQAMHALHCHLAASQVEIGALREEVRRTREASLADSLTGLANRRAFDQQLAACLAVTAAGASPPPSLIMGDIDHFKLINDRFGHGFGDLVLKTVGHLLKGRTPEGALAARVGGEEFALLLPNMSIEAARDLAEDLRMRIGAARIRRPSSNETLDRITWSLGVTWHRLGESAEAFMARVDQALYASKHGGRDRVTLLAPT